MGKDRNAAARTRLLQAQARALGGSMVHPLGWRPLVGTTAPEGALQAFANDRCTVTIWRREQPWEHLHVEVAPSGRPLAWEELQQVKNEAVHPMADAVEIYPSVAREIKGERKQHLFCMPPGQEWPVGMVPPAEAARRAKQAALMEQIAAFVKDKVVQVVPAAAEGQDVRVYRDADDLHACAAEGEARPVSLGNLPAEDQAGIWWSDAARAYRDQVFAEVQALVAAVEAEEQARAEVSKAGGTALAIPTSDQVQAISEEAMDAEDAEQEAEAAAALERLRAEMAKDK